MYPRPRALWGKHRCALDRLSYAYSYQVGSVSTLSCLEVLFGITFKQVVASIANSLVICIRFKCLMKHFWNKIFDTSWCIFYRPDPAVGACLAELGLDVPPEVRHYYLHSLIIINREGEVKRFLWEQNMTLPHSPSRHSQTPFSFWSGNYGLC